MCIITFAYFFKYFKNNMNKYWNKELTLNKETYGKQRKNFIKFLKIHIYFDILFKIQKQKFKPAAFNWGPGTIAALDSSFFWGYLVTQIPGGYLAAKFPANRFLFLVINLNIKYLISYKLKSFWNCFSDFCSFELFSTRSCQVQCYCCDVC